MTTTALDWLRAKATDTEPYTIEVSEAAAAEDNCEPGVYRVERQHFLGRLPFRMIKELKGCKVEQGGDVYETLHIGGEYRSDDCRCEFWRTTYTLVTQ